MIQTITDAQLTTNFFFWFVQEEHNIVSNAVKPQEFRSAVLSGLCIGVQQYCGALHMSPRVCVHTVIN